MTSTRSPQDVFRLPGFALFWTAESVSLFGVYVTTIALQVLVVLELDGTAADVGLVNAARWLPYLLLGLVLGAIVERWRRKPVMVVTDLGRAALLTAIPVLWFTGLLSLPTLIATVGLLGVLSLLNDAASQSFLPRLVAADRLLAANARIDQSEAVAQTSGPVLGGALVTVWGAPLAVLTDAVGHLVSAVAVWRIKITEPLHRREPGARLWRDVKAGVRWGYRHRTLAPLALSTHIWFLFNSMATTALVPFILSGLGLSPAALGVAMAAAGVAGLGGSLLAVRVGLRWGAGPTVIACRILAAVAWAAIALVPDDPLFGQQWTLTALLAGCQFLYGTALGLENANEMGYRQITTPDHMQARVNTTMRSVNRAMIVVGAPVGGLLADSIGHRPVFLVAAAGFGLAVLTLLLSPFRTARHDDAAA
ncbi:putative MFS family arabinose efflux permease [Stackebrandtia albiflava]|uniref:Putative MFS family arabinose efflux permease n=1 Tax=Stackebrandtia albiflava TaxID=406432 RepID=A0A562V0I6_9ACTN|nr:MFS transporter [Stackebrandtia albiflava]TWJ11446.1 putative MFS family arabinose efflux permease [Stackebrandtia albiflava]